MNNKLLLAVVGLIVLLGAGAFLLLSNNSTPQTQNTPTIEESQIEETSITPEASEESEATQVTLTSSGFSPKDITIKKGAKVVWTNNSGTTSTVHSNPHPIHTSFPELNLGEFANGETLEFTFSETGTFSYHNHLNSSQGGSVTVEE